MIRQPIVAVLGHVDHGKTTLLDAIRGTAVAAKEPGLITQHTGASEIPLEIIKGICGPLLEKFKIKIEIPGLLFIDTPGHEAFTTIRSRGSSIADLAILVIDINEGFKPQTDESLEFLKEFKTPFLVAATKIDKIPGWIVHSGACFYESFEAQPEHVRAALDEKVYSLVGQLSERGFDAERFDRVRDFRKQIAIVPCSGITKEGIPELLVMLAGLAQTFLKGALELKPGAGKGSILEIKETKGLGITADVILYDGEIRKGDWLVIGGREPLVTRVRAILKPKPLKELRIEKKFESIEIARAACGIKICAPDLERAIAGMPIRALRSEKDIEAAKAELVAVTSEFESAIEGVVVRADTLGSLEALVHMAKKHAIAVKKAEVGPPTRKDIMELDGLADPLKKVIFAFNVQIPPELAREAKDRAIKIISSNIIYELFDQYNEWLKAEKEKLRQAKLARITLPAKIRILPGFVFRASEPAIVGIEVLAGEIRPGVKLKKAGKEIGTVKEIQSEGVSIQSAKAGQRVALSIIGPTVGRQIKEGDELVTAVTQADVRALEELEMFEEAKLARELLNL